MPDQPLFFKRKHINENDAELTFYKECTWIYSPDPLPVVNYKLVDCRNIQIVEWDTMDEFNDGVIVESLDSDEHFIFQTTDLGGHQVKIECAQIIREDSEYTIEDLIDLTDESEKHRDAEAIVTARLRDKAEELKRFIVHELDIVERKVTQAEWLSEDKRNYLFGQRDALQKIRQFMI
jgi:hypothetical protein